jgi:hypothetical protein
LETLLHDIGFTCLLSLPTWGQCGWASLPSALSYGLQLSDEGIELPVKRCLVPSCYSGGGTFPRGVKPSGLDIQWSVDCLGTYVTESYME